MTWVCNAGKQAVQASSPSTSLRATFYPVQWQKIRKSLTKVRVDYKVPRIQCPRTVNESEEGFSEIPGTRKVINVKKRLCHQPRKVKQKKRLNWLIWTVCGGKMEVLGVHGESG